jgi:hypothetical protein
MSKPHEQALDAFARGDVMAAADIIPEIDTSTPELECEARLLQAYLLHIQAGGKALAFIAKAQQMAEHVEQVFAESECVDDRLLP